VALAIMAALAIHNCNGGITPRGERLPRIANLAFRAPDARK